MSRTKLIRGYPEYMLESIEGVHKTREARMKEGLRDPMSMDDRKNILDKFHPDYKKDNKRRIKVGPNVGTEHDLMPHEMADVIEAHPAIKSKDIDLNQVDFDVDVLVIGGGGAGTVASLWANYEGIPKENILMVTKLRHGDSNSMMAQGGIQAADRDVDSPLIHFMDAIGGGHFTNDRKIVRALVRDGPKIIKWHEELGVSYDRNEDGTFVVLPGGGTSRNRMHAAKDYTGMEILRVLRDEFCNKEIPVVEFLSAVELILDDKGNAAGAVLVNMETEQYYVARAKSVVMATGGFGRLHVCNFATTNHYGATADGLVMAYHAGAPLRDMDAVQYHPTGAAFPNQIIGLLITEKTRSLGGEPVNKDGKSFVFPLEPRDVEASTFIKECQEGRGISTPTGFKGIWLDTPRIEAIRGEGTIQANLSAMYKMFKRFDIDMTQDPILVYPTLHYQNGGIVMDEFANIPAIKGLFAGGECEGGPHGKNRLMGNSLLDYNVFGRIAGISAAVYAKKVSTPKNLSLVHLDKYEEALTAAGIQTDRHAPILLPDYRKNHVLNRSIDIWHQ